MTKRGLKELNRPKNLKVPEGRDDLPELAEASDYKEGIGKLKVKDTKLT